MTKYLIYTIIFLLMGCATMETQQRMGLLESATRRYGEAVRWGHYEIAKGFKAPDADDEGASNSELPKTIKVTSYEPLNLSFSNDNFEARQTAEIRYYFINQMIEKTLIDTQVWKYDTEDERWYIHTSLPEFIQE